MKNLSTKIRVAQFLRHFREQLALRIIAKAAEVTSFEWLDGNGQWEQEYLDRLRRTVFIITSDGSFTMSEPDGHGTIVGTISDYATFRASKQTAAGSTGGGFVKTTGENAMKITKHKTANSGGTAAFFHGMHRCRQTCTTRRTTAPTR